MPKSITPLPKDSSPTPLSLPKISVPQAVKSKTPESVPTSISPFPLEAETLRESSLPIDTDIKKGWAYRLKQALNSFLKRWFR